MGEYYDAREAIDEYKRLAKTDKQRKIADKRIKYLWDEYLWRGAIKADSYSDYVEIKKQSSNSDNKSFKFMAYSVAFDMKDGAGYGKWQQCSISISVRLNEETNKMQIYIMTDPPQIFTVFKSNEIGGGLGEIDGGMRWFCTDQDGKMPHVRMIKKSKGVFHFYIDYSNMSYVYECGV